MGLGELAIVAAPAAELERAGRALQFFYRNAPPGVYLDLEADKPLPAIPERPRSGSWPCQCGRMISATRKACKACSAAV